MSASRTPAREWGWEETGPVWGARAYPPKSGQDHLGLGSVSSDRILPALSPGINVLTVHPRYWSFYSWVLSDFWAANLPRTRRAFRDFYRPREALFSMACHVCDAPEHVSLVANIVGSRRTAALAETQNFDPQFDYIKEPLGGYGLYYRTTMELMGALIIATPTNGLPFDVPTPVGQAIAEAFRGAIAGTQVATILGRSEVTSPVTRAALVEFARAACLCQLRKAESHDLPLLQDLFLHSGAPQQANARRLTFRMLLDLSTCSVNQPITPDAFRQLIYFRALDGSRYEPHSDLVDVARSWRVYQAREYFAYAFNRLLRWVTRRGLDATGAGLTLLPKPNLWDLVTNAIDGSAKGADVGLTLPNVTSTTLVADLLDDLVDQVHTEAKCDDVWPRCTTLDEHDLYLDCQNLDVDDGQTLVVLIAILLLIRQRFGLPERLSEYSKEQGMLIEGGSLRIGMARFMHLLNQRLLTNPTVAELAKWLIEDFVIVQHERVATAKLPDDTFRVRRVGDDLRFFDQFVPVDFNDSRFNALSTTVHELGWVDAFRKPDRQLTDSGQELLSKGDLAAGVLQRAVAKVDLKGAGR